MGAFSAAGSLFAYSSFDREDGQPDGVYVISPDGLNPILVAGSPDSPDPVSDPRWAVFVSWSSNGHILYKQAAHQVYG